MPDSLRASQAEGGVGRRPPLASPGHQTPCRTGLGLRLLPGSPISHLGVKPSPQTSAPPSWGFYFLVPLGAPGLQREAPALKSGLNTHRSCWSWRRELRSAKNISFFAPQSFLRGCNGSSPQGSYCVCVCVCFGLPLPTRVHCELFPSLEPTAERGAF